MLSKIYAATLTGLDAQIIEVEVDVARGERRISIVGLPDKAVQEARDRILSAFRNSKFDLGSGHKIINLAPADIPKIGPAYDLPMAIGLLTAKSRIKVDPSSKLFLGELSLDGRLRPINGVLAIVESARKLGFNEFFVPSMNAKEASLVPNVKVYPVETLKQVCLHFQKKEILPTKPYYPKRQKISSRYDLAYVQGQIKARRALEIAAAGGHNLLFSGVPGSGKTYMSRCLAEILPDMTFDESIEVTRIYSIAGELGRNEPLIVNRPFRNPHHTSSHIALVGGGSIPRPGEISLAHKGILFLDELPEFNQRTLEVLRQPMEDKNVHISRARGNISFPADFQLVAAMNPCKCGFWGDEDKECTCSENERTKYKRKISGPMMDRIDLQVFISKVKFGKLASLKRNISSLEIKRKVQNARNIQLERYEGSKVTSNSQMGMELIRKSVPSDSESRKLLRQAVDIYNLSARGYYRVLKVARTIADLENSESIKEEHIAEALSFRMEI